MSRCWVASTSLAEGQAVAVGRAAARPTRVHQARLTQAVVHWAPALPLLLLALALLVLPTIMVVVQSVRGEAGQWTLEFWAETFQRRGDRVAIVTSLSLGVACATLSLLIGAPLAWFLSRSQLVTRTAWLSLLNVGANFGGIGLAFGFMASLGTYGMVTLVLQQTGLGFVPPTPASFLGLLLVYLYTNVPLFVLLTLPAMRVVEADTLEAASTLGATKAETARFIGLPVLAPFLAAGWLLIFTWSIGIYGLAYALAGNAATNQLRLMTLQIGIALNSAAGSQGRAAVMATLLLVIATLSLLAYRLTMRRAVRWLA